MLSIGDTRLEYSVVVTGGFALTSAATGTMDANASGQLAVSYAPVATGVQTGALTVSFTVPATSPPTTPAPTPPADISCALSCTGLTNAPSWDGGISSLAFSYVQCGASLDGVAIVLNPAGEAGGSDEPCSVTATLTGAGFSVTPSGATTIAEGGLLGLTVRFAPPTSQSAAELAYSGTLTVAWSRVGSTGTLTLPLSGTGLNPTEIDKLSGEAKETATERLASAVKTDAGTSKQRATLYVPTWSSHISAGASYVPAGQTRTQNGFSATTSRNVFFRAEKSVTYQANGQVWFQSEQDSLYAVSVDGTSMVGKNALYLGGGGFLAFMAGYGAVGTPADLRNSGDNDPGQPDGVSSISTAVATADIIWEVTDKLVGVFTLFKALERAIKLNWNKSLASSALAITGAVIQTAATLGGLTLYIMGKAMGTPSKSINMYSQAGILAGTPAFCSIYGAMGVNYRSLNVTLLGNIAVAVSSGLSSTLDSLYGDTAVNSCTKLTVESWTSTFVYCTQGPLNVYGKAIELGGVKPDGGQLPTLTMKVSALNKIHLKTSSPVGGKVALAAKGAPVGKLENKALMDVKYMSKGISMITVAKKWKIIANGREIVIQGASGPVLKLSAAGVEIGPAAGQLKIAPALVDIGAGALKVTPSAITTTVAHADLL